MKKLFSIILLLLLQVAAKAQFLDSLQVKAGTSVTVASKDYLPLWLVANRFGVISDQQFDFSTHFRLSNTNIVQFGTPTIYNKNEDNALHIDYGIDVYNNNHLKKTIIQEGFVRVKYRKATFSAGRFKQVIGEMDHDLSSGSLGLSGNALPVPKLNLAIDYFNIPFTNGWVQAKGMISHGWMGNDQFLKNAYLHEKNVYLRIGKNKLKLYGGLQHYAVWGGERDNFFALDRSWAGFWNVFLVKEANDGSVVTDILPNRAGDHRGVIEAGAEWENDDYRINLNNQTPFDMGQNIDTRNIDRLLSLSFYNKKPEAKLKKVVVEFIHTKQMNDFYAEHVRESYYNNGIYRTGWSYNERILGTPLFIDRQRGSKYFDDVEPYDWDGPTSEIQPTTNVISNRVVGGHVGVDYEVQKGLTSRTLLTYTNNFGNYNARQFRDRSYSQWYSMQQFSWIVPQTQLSLTGTIAYDFGSLSNNFGSMIGLQWQLRN